MDVLSREGRSAAMSWCVRTRQVAEAEVAVAMPGRNLAHATVARQIATAPAALALLSLLKDGQTVDTCQAVIDFLLNFDSTFAIPVSLSHRNCSPGSGILRL